MVKKNKQVIKQGVPISRTRRMIAVNKETYEKIMKAELIYRKQHVELESIRLSRSYIIDKALDYIIDKFEK